MKISYLLSNRRNLFSLLQVPGSSIREFCSHQQKMRYPSEVKLPWYVRLRTHPRIKNISMPSLGTIAVVSVVTVTAAGVFAVIGYPYLNKVNLEKKIQKRPKSIIRRDKNEKRTVSFVTCSNALFIDFFTFLIDFQQTNNLCCLCSGLLQAAADGDAFASGYHEGEGCWRPECLEGPFRPQIIGKSRKYGKKFRLFRQISPPDLVRS